MRSISQIYPERQRSGLRCENEVRHLESWEKTPQEKDCSNYSECQCQCQCQSHTHGAR